MPTHFLGSVISFAALDNDGVIQDKHVDYLNTSSLLMIEMTMMMMMIMMTMTIKTQPLLSWHS